MARGGDFFRGTVQCRVSGNAYDDMTVVDNDFERWAFLFMRTVLVGRIERIGETQHACQFHGNGPVGEVEVLHLFPARIRQGPAMIPRDDRG